MNILQMRYFLAVAETGNITSTAEKLFLSPSALSKSIARLESDMGVQLFERNSTGMQLTTAGVKAQKAMSEALRLLDDLQASIASDATQEQMRLDIVSSASASGSDMVSAFTHAHPEIFVFFKEIFLPDLEAGDLISKYDFLISASNSVSGETLISTPLFPHAPVVLVPENHPLAAQDDISLEEIAKEPFIASPANMPWTSFVEGLFKSRGLTVTPVMECIYSVRARSVAAGVGLTIVSAMGAKLHTPPPGVAIRPLRDEYPPHDMCLFYHPLRRRNQAARMFIRFATDYYSGERK